MVFVAILITIVVSYLLGSIPSGYLLVKLIKGIDVRTVGSGNIGATNVKRVLGMKGFLAVLALDALKGYLPVTVFSAIFGGANNPWIPILAAIAAVVGHTFTIFLNFKGGKGVATSLGVFIALAPASVATDMIIFGILLYFFRYISLGSIMCAFLLPVFIYIYGEQGFLYSVLVLAVAMASFVIYKHKDNIRRLLDGTESRFDAKKEDKPKEKEGKK